MDAVGGQSGVGLEWLRQFRHTPRAWLTVPANWQQASQAAAGTGELGQRVSDRSAWWLALNDPVLNQLVEQAQARNVNLAQAAVKVQRRSW